MSNEFVTLKREVLEQALEAIELNWKTDEGDAVKPLLRAALKQPGVDPVAEVVYLERGGNAGIATRIVEIDDPYRERLQAGTKLYTAPQPAQRNDVEKEALLRALHAIDTVAVALPTFQVNTDGGIDAVAANIVAAIKSAANLLEKGGAAPQPAQQAVPEIDYQALVHAAYAANRKWTAGTTGCIAFKHGAEWFRSTLTQPAQQPETDKLLRQALEAMEVQGSEWVILEQNAIAAIRKYFGEA